MYKKGEACETEIKLSKRIYTSFKEWNLPENVKNQFPDFFFGKNHTDFSKLDNNEEIFDFYKRSF